ncbi:MAG: VOC family protein [Patulibacter minatonensis]
MSATAELQITGVDFVCIPTTDHDRSCVFYGDVLGLPKRAQWGDRPATEFQAGNLTLVVFDPRGFGQQDAATRSSVPVAALAVPDVEEARELLKAKGVQFIVDWIDSGVCHQALLLDPDGNTLILHHRYAPPTA